MQIRNLFKQKKKKTYLLGWNGSVQSKIAPSGSESLPQQAGHSTSPPARRFLYADLVGPLVFAFVLPFFFFSFPVFFSFSVQFFCFYLHFLKYSDLKFLFKFWNPFNFQNFVQILIFVQIRFFCLNFKIRSFLKFVQILICIQILKTIHIL
jgi:hypothetical protein